MGQFSDSLGFYSEVSNFTTIFGQRDKINFWLHKWRDLTRFATRLYFEYFTRVIFLEAHEKSVGNSTNRQIMIHCTFTLQSMHFTIQLIIIHHEISFIQSYKYFCTISNSITQSNNNFPLAMPILDGCFGYRNL